MVADLGEDVYVSPALFLSPPFKFTKKWKLKNKKQLARGIREGCRFSSFRGNLPGILHVKPRSCSRERSNALQFYFLSVGKWYLKVGVTEDHRAYVAALATRKPEPCL